jgi:hypothetical protein
MRISDAFLRGNSQDTLKDSLSNDENMITGPSKPTIQWGSRDAVKGEVKWRVHTKSSWKSILILVLAFLAFFVYLVFLDFFS